MTEEQAGSHWLVLVFQFPKGRDSLRVKVWRRLQRIGAVAIKNSVYVLPQNDQSQEDFAWLLQELQKSGADAALLESRFVDGMSDQQVRGLFNTARASDYDALANEISAAAASLPTRDSDDDQQAFEQARQVLRRARTRLAEVEDIDFFGAEGHDAAESAIRSLHERTIAAPEAALVPEAKPVTALDELKGRLWVTRRGVRVDRIASAWLIRGWIDPDAQFKFVSGKGYERESEREVRFDMFDAEYTHEGDLCTFEVLARLVADDDAAVRSIGEIVHDIDLKDGKFGRPETAGVANLLSGIVAGTDDDEVRLERGGNLFGDLYRFFSEQSG